MHFRFRNVAVAAVPRTSVLLLLSLLAGATASNSLQLSAHLLRHVQRNMLSSSAATGILKFGLLRQYLRQI